MAQTDSLTPWLRQAFIRLVAERTGLKIRENDQEVFKEIILKRTQKSDVTFPEAYYQLLESRTDESHKEWKNLILEITNSESFFFRDKGQFQLLRNRIFPSLIQEKSSEKTLRICSAGCSTGQEPYSIAILLRELIPDIEQWNLTILGIDINSASIEKAQTGIYRSWSLRGLEQHTKRRFFQESDGDYHIDQTIKNMVTFQTVNLLSDPFSDLTHDIRDMDLILCRNVFIYFSDSAIKTVLNKFYDALRPYGYLLVGHAELHSQNLNQFQIKVFEESIAYQRSAQAPIHPMYEISPIQPILPPAPKLSTASDPQAFENMFTGQDINMQKAALNLLRQLPANTKISKLGNLTASELILQLEQSLRIADGS